MMARIFIIGAGFSVPAGMPIADNLYQRVVKLAEKRFGGDAVIFKDINRFIKYKSLISGRVVLRSEIDFEEFISFLDIEHFMGFWGSDALNDQGNASQHLIRNLLSEVLYEDVEKAKETDLSLYKEFASRLEPGDILVTFNYDNLLESIFEELKIDFRLFPYRYTWINDDTGTASIDLNTDEIIYLKMHGSIDWFSIKPFHEFEDAWARFGEPPPPHLSPIFSQKDKFNPTPLVDGPNFKTSGLNDIYVVRNIDRYFDPAESMRYSSESPIVLAPSQSKILYSRIINDFWYGFSREGSGLKSLVILGYSMPTQDNYIKQALWNLVENYLGGSSDGGEQEKRIRIVDYRTTASEIDALKSNWGFLDWNSIDTHLSGFNQESIEFVFSEA